MIVGVIGQKCLLVGLVLKERIHALNLKIHLNTGGQGLDQFCDGLWLLALSGIHGSADGGKKMGMIRGDDLLWS